MLSDSPGVNKRNVLRLYPSKHDMDKLLDEDQKRFTNAMSLTLGQEQDEDPLYPTAKKFIEAPVTLSAAAAELGVKDADVLQAFFKLPEFTRLGLAGLSSGGVIHRDTWEDYFDRVVRRLGVGVPIAPIDGATRLDHLSTGLADGLTIKTNHQSNVFSPGDEMVITVENQTGVNLFVELVGTSARGRKVALSKGVLPLTHGQTYRFPEKGGVKIQPRLGVEFITVFANPEKFDPGVLLRGEHLADRYVHEFYKYNRTGARVDNRPSRLVKKTLKIETR